MATYRISANTTTGTNMRADNDVWIVNPNVTVSVSTDDAFFGGKEFTGNEIRVNGTVEATGSFYAFSMLGRGTKVDINATGEVTADGTALWMRARGANIINSGSIEGGNFAVRVEEFNSELSNEGTITSANTAVRFSGTNNEVENSGTITGKVGVTSQGLARETFELTNSGTLTGTKYAFVGSDAKETVSNSGTINGDVYLRAGDDVFAFRGGTVTGTVYGGNGDDTYRIGKAGLTINEVTAGGTDKVVATIAYTLGAFLEDLQLNGNKAIDGTGNNLQNAIAGNAGANVLSGLAGNDALTGAGGADQLLGGNGNDKLNGGAGNDALTGGASRDTFIFAANAGQDRVTDFTATGASRDVVDVSTVAAIVSFQDLQANHMDQVGADVVITYAGSKITLEDVTLGDLTASNFLI